MISWPQGFSTRRTVVGPERAVGAAVVVTVGSIRVWVRFARKHPDDHTHALVTAGSRCRTSVSDGSKGLYSGLPFTFAHAARTHHRDHRPGRFVPFRAAAPEGI